MYTTGATKGSAIPYPGGISAPDINNFIKVVEANSSNANVARLLKIATSNAARKIKGASGPNACPELDAKLAKAKSFEEADDILYGKPGIDCCAKTMPRTLCENAFGAAENTLDTVSAMPIIGQIYDATMGHLFQIARNKRKARQVDAKMGMAQAITSYVSELEAWFEIRALIELGYPDLAAFLHDCRGVLSKGKYATRRRYAPAKVVVTPYMTWHGSDLAREQWKIWKDKLIQENNPGSGINGGCRIFRGPGYSEGPAGLPLEQRNDLQRWLLNRHYTKSTEIVGCDRANYPQDPTRGNRSRRGVIDYRDAADPMGPNCLRAAGSWSPVAWLFFYSMADKPGDLSGFLGIQPTLWKEGGKYRALINRWKQNKTIKEICKEGSGWASYHSGSWYSSGSVRRSGNTPEQCASQLAIRLARIQLLSDYQGRGGVPNVAEGRRWINNRYAEELAFLKKLKMSETQKAGAYAVKKTTAKSTAKTPSAVKSAPLVVKYDAVSGKHSGIGPVAILGGLAAAYGAWYFLKGRKRG